MQSFYDTVLETWDKNQSRKKSPLIEKVIRIHLATLGILKQGSVEMFLGVYGEKDDAESYD